MRVGAERGRQEVRKHALIARHALLGSALIEEEVSRQIQTLGELSTHPLADFLLSVDVLLDRQVRICVAESFSEFFRSQAGHLYLLPEQFTFCFHGLREQACFCETTHTT